MEYPREIFCSLLFLWKKTQTSEWTGGKNIYRHMYLYADLPLSFYPSTCINILFRDSSLRKPRGHSADLGHRDAIRKESHLMVMWVVVTDQAGNLS